MSRSITAQRDNDWFVSPYPDWSEPRPFRPLSVTRLADSLGRSVELRGQNGGKVNEEHHQGLSDYQRCEPSTEVTTRSHDLDEKNTRYHNKLVGENDEWVGLRRKTTFSMRAPG